jgi:hypothetical protein
MYRFVICVDIPADSLKEAYIQLYNKMMESGLAWESSDEAYDDAGEEISEADLSETRVQAITEMEET